jgi:hypothetical protein
MRAPNDMDASPSRSLTLGFGLLLGLLFAACVWINAGPLWLVADIVSTEQNVAQVFYSHSETWSEEQSQTLPLRPGMDRVAFRVKAPELGNSVRLDPGSRPGLHRILSLRWSRGLLAFDTPLDTVRNGRPDAASIRLVEGRLELTAADDDPQLLVPVPDAAWRVGSLVWPSGAIAAGILVLLVAVWRGRLGLLGIANAYLAAWIAFYFLLFAIHGPTLPFHDDWRYVLPGAFNLVEGRWDWLRVVGNDTYFLTGQIIDFLILNVSNVDFAAVRLVAFCLLLVHIWATHRIALRSTIASARWIPAVSIALIAWSLASNSYWGGTAIAYHQFLPVLFGTLMLMHLADRSGEFNARWSVLLLVVASLASGLSYITGGMFVLALSAAVLLTHADLLRRSPLVPAVRAALLLGALGAAFLLLQVALVNNMQGSLMDHSHATATVYPTDRRFWLFVFGLFGRALGYSGDAPLADALLALLALAPVLLLGVERVWNGLLRGLPCERRLITTVSLYAGIASLVYAAAVAFGRAGFAPPDASAKTVLAVAKGRFHYWPVAALLPFFWLGWAELAPRLRGRLGLLPIAVAVLMLVPKSLTPWDLVRAFRTTTTPSARGAYCIASQVHEAVPGRPIICDAITLLPIDLSTTMKRLHDDNRVLYRDIAKIGQPSPNESRSAK